MSHRPRLSSIEWFLRLRSLAILGQAATLYAAYSWLKIDLELVPLTIIFIITLLSSAVLWRYLRSVPQGQSFVAGLGVGAEVQHPWLLGTIILLDVLLHTLLLYFSGGPENPFSILYLLHVVVCAVLLQPFWAWSIAGLTTLAFGFLFSHHVPIMALHHHMGTQDGMNLHLLGMLIAYGLVACISAYCVSQIAGELRFSERERERLRTEKRQLASLTTLAAGAAHELSTPLATIALVVEELKQSTEISEEFRSDYDLIERQIATCKHILTQMGVHSGEISGEMPQEIELRGFLGELAEVLREAYGKLVCIEEPSFNLLLPIPKITMLKVFQSIVKNGLEAANFESPVQIRTEYRNNQVSFLFLDYGSGMNDDVVRRAGQPFFTTKEVGKGMGLGLFLARLTAEQLGGSLSFRSRGSIGSERGTSVEFLLPVKNITVGMS